MTLVVDDIDHLRPGLRFVATVGVFDGVHLGHAHVLERLRGLAHALGATPVAITFDPHPQAVITGRAPDLICDPSEKLARMADAGAETIVVQRFDEAFRSQTAEEFLGRLARGRDLAGLVMSHESAFGRDRQGTVDAVRRLAARDGFRLVEVDTLEVDGEPVSSSRIRGAVAAGDLATAERLLGRRYAVTGAVVCDADGQWRLTPNGSVTLPPPGTYAIKASWLVADPDHAIMGGRERGPIPDRPNPLLPGQLGLGMVMIEDDGPCVLSVHPAPVDARDGVVRVQFVAALGDGTSLGEAARGVLDRAREGDVAIRAEWVETGDAYVAHWDLTDTPSGLGECCYPTFETVDDALEWARQRAPRVKLTLPQAGRPAGDAPAWAEWSAGDEPIEGLRAWDERRPRRQ